MVLAAKLTEYEGLGLSGGIGLVVPKVLVAQKPAAAVA